MQRECPTPPEESIAKLPTILVVDDEELLLTALECELRDQGFWVLRATSGRRALRTYKRHFPRVDLVLLDLRMPDWSGERTLRALRRFDPSVRCCFMGAAASPPADSRSGALAAFPKPIHVEDIATLLEELNSRLSITQP